MRSPAAAVAWEFRRRHRWGLLALAGYLLVLLGIKLLVPDAARHVNLKDVEVFALVDVVPLTATLTYFLAAFSFGYSGDLAARQSMYPARMFALPVTTSALAGWPMLYGSAAMALLWLATRLAAVWPTEFDVPVIWPALLAAALLAWTQALMWMPYGLPGVRVVVAVLWLAVIDTVALLALHFNAHEPVMVAILAPQVPLAYLVARFAVARARRGDVPDWSGLFARVGQIAGVGPRRRKHFASPARAHVWFEWRRHGRSLPALVGILLPFELALLWLAGNDAPGLVFFIICGVLLTPPFMAAFVAATVRRSNPNVGESGGVSTFIATRPLTNAALVRAKLTATIWSTLGAWLLVVVAIPLALALSGTDRVVIDRERQIIDAIGMPRAIVVALLAFAGLLASTWKQLVQSLFIGLTGRESLVKASVFLALTLLTIVGPLAVWVIEHRSIQVTIWNALPWILGVLACLKVSAAGWIATRLYRSRVLSDRTLVTGAACWLAAVLALHAVLAWLVPELLMPRYLLALVAILAIPLARLSAAPLALAWNRHR